MPSQSYFNKLFSLYAPAYPIISAFFKGSRKRVIDLLEEKVDSVLMPRVLLVGAGDGVDIPYFKRNTELTYLDASKGMYQKARKKFADRGKLIFEHSDFLDYQSTHMFDVICIHFCLSVTNRPSKVIEKAGSLLADNGYLSIMDIAQPKTSRFSRSLNSLTKFSMFNLHLNIDDLMSQSKTRCTLKEKSILKESKLFASFLYLKESNE